MLPILMTGLATITGLVPTAIGLDRATASNQPLALAVVGGLMSSTLLSLFVVSSIFLLSVRNPKTMTVPEPRSLPNGVATH